MKNILIALAALLLIATLNAQTSAKIQYDSLPVPVREHLLKKYASYKVSDVRKAVDPSGTVSYLIEARLQQKPNVALVLSLVYDANGILLSSKKEKEVSYTGNEPVHEAPHSGGDGHRH